MKLYTVLVDLCASKYIEEEYDYDCSYGVDVRVLGTYDSKEKAQQAIEQTKEICEKTAVELGAYSNAWIIEQELNNTDIREYHETYDDGTTHDFTVIGQLAGQYRE